MSGLLLVTRKANETRHNLGQRCVLFRDSGIRDRVEGLECDLESLAVFAETSLGSLDDGDDGRSEVGATSRLDVRESSAQEGKDARLNGRVGHLEEPQERVGEGLDGQEGDRRMDIVLGRFAQLEAILCREGGGDRRSEVEETAHELGKGRVDRLAAGRASRIDLAEQLLGLQNVAESAEEVGRLLLSLRRRRRLGRRVGQERDLEVEDLGELVDDLTVGGELDVDRKVLNKRERESGGIECRLALLVDQEHDNGGQELLRPKGFDETHKEVDATVTRDVRRGIGERPQKLLELLEEGVATAGSLLRRLDERGNDAVERLVDHTQAVGVVALQDIRSHEREDGHDVVHKLVGNEGSELGEEQKRLVVRLRVDRGPHKVENRRHADRVAGDAGLGRDLVNDARKRREDELTRVRDIGLARSGREVDQRGEDLEEVEEQGMRSCDVGNIDRLEQRDQLGQAFGARGGRGGASDRHPAALGTLRGRRCERRLDVGEVGGQGLAVGLEQTKARSDIVGNTSLGADREPDQALEQLEASVGSHDGKDGLGDQTKTLLAESCAQACVEKGVSKRAEKRVVGVARSPAMSWTSTAVTRTSTA